MISLTTSNGLNVSEGFSPKAFPFKKIAFAGLMITTIGATLFAPIATATVAATVATAIAIDKTLDWIGPHLPALAQKAVFIALTILREIASLACIASIYMFSLAKAEDRWLQLKAEGIDAGQEPINTEQTPILLIHGFMDNSSSWYWQKERLQKAGFGPIYTIDLGSPLLSINDYVKKVEEKTALIKKVHDRPDLQLIGHSMGGLVASHYASQHPDDVKTVITLGSPLQGTKLAPLGSALFFGQSSCVTEMMSHSPFVNALAENIKTLNNTDFYTFTSDTDEIVFPVGRDTFAERTRAEEVKFKQMGHVQYFLSQKVTDEMIRVLNKVKPDLPKTV